MRFTPLSAPNGSTCVRANNVLHARRAADRPASTPNDAVTVTHARRYRPPTFHVQAWYDEVKDYTFPYPQECDPYCPFRCSGPVCTHYTQVSRPQTGLVDCNILVPKPLLSKHLNLVFFFFSSTFFPQLVWATSSRIGCAVNLCYNMNVWGQIWAKAVYLVCNYSPK